MMIFWYEMFTVWAYIRFFFEGMYHGLEAKVGLQRLFMIILYWEMMVGV